MRTYKYRISWHGCYTFAETGVQLDTAIADLQRMGAKVESIQIELEELEEAKRDAVPA